MPSISAPVAMLGAAGIGAAGSIIGGSQAASAANHAADVQRQMYETTRSDLLPYNTAGQGDFGAYNKLITGAPSQIQAKLEGLPGFQFADYQGLKGVQNSAAARGLGVSGAALKGAANFATGLADTTFGEQANRLLQGAGLGENAAAQTGNAGAQISQGVGNALIKGGQAAAAGTAGAANAIGTPLLNYGMYGQGNPNSAYMAGYNAADPWANGPDLGDLGG